MEQQTDDVGITSIDEVLEGLQTQIQRGGVDIDVSAKTLRQYWSIADTLTDDEIEQAITKAFRSLPGPNLVVTLCGGMIVAEVALCHYPEADELEDVHFDLEDRLSHVYGGDISLSTASNDACGYGVLIAYRMPPRYYQPYKAGDEHLIERFGTEVRRYSQKRLRHAA